MLISVLKSTSEFERRRHFFSSHFCHTPLESLEAEVVVVEITVRNDGRIEALLVILDDSVHVVGDQSGLLPGLGVHVVIQFLDHITEHL